MLKESLLALLFTLLLCTSGTCNRWLTNDGPVNQSLRVQLADNNWKGSSGDQDQGSSLQASPNRGKKSLFKAVVYSLLVPGGGQIYYGNKTKAKYFIGVEALTWIGYISFRTYGNWRRDDMVNYAATYANAELEGKSDEFIDLVGFYTDINEYNSLGRAWDPEREYLFDTPENHWVWQSSAEQRTFRDLKNRSREAYRRADFMIGLAIVNRVLSVIDAVRGTNKANRRLGGFFSIGAEGRFRLAINPLSTRRQLTISLPASL